MSSLGSQRDFLARPKRSSISSSSKETTNSVRPFMVATAYKILWLDAIIFETRQQRVSPLIECHHQELPPFGHTLRLSQNNHAPCTYRRNRNPHATAWRPWLGKGHVFWRSDSPGPTGAFCTHSRSFAVNNRRQQACKAPIYIKRLFPLISNRVATQWGERHGTG